MIEVKNAQLNNDTLETLNKIVDLDINAGAAFKLMRIIKELSSIIEDKNSTEKKIYSKWIEKDENGNPLPALDEQGNVIENAVKITSPTDFTNELSDLMGYTNKIGYDKLKFDELGLDSQVKVKDLMKIDFLFE